MKWRDINELDRRDSQSVLVAQDHMVKILHWNAIRQMWENPETGDDVLPRSECGQPTHYCDYPDAPA